MGEMMIFWLVLLIVCIVIELPTMGLTTIWFAGGALVAILAALLHVPVFLQVILFLLVSLLLLFFTRPIAVKYFNKDRVKTNVESMVGRQAIVTSEIFNLQATGQVTVGGQEWSARSCDDQMRIPEGSVVTVVAIHGVKLIVKVDARLNDKLSMEHGMWERADKMYSAGEADQTEEMSQTEANQTEGMYSAGEADQMKGKSQVEEADQMKGMSQVEEAGQMEGISQEEEAGQF